MSPTISVIVPVYNSEPYLERCVNSILRQDFSDFELLLVDDGSTPPCAKLCDTLAKQDPRIRVFHTLNGGTSTARNYGLAHAAGQYIAFADSDDYVLKNWLSAMYYTAIQEHADIVKSGFYEVNNDDYQEMPDGSVAKPENYLNIIQYSNGDISGFYFLKNLASNGFGSVWNQLVKRELFDSRKFPDGHLAEDVRICSELCQVAKKITCIDAVAYCYVQHATSQLHLVSEDFVADNIAFWLELADVFLHKYHCKERYHFAKAYAALGFLAHSCSSVRIDQNFEDPTFWRKLEQIKRNVPLWHSYRYLGPRLSLQFTILKFSPTLYKTLINLVKSND